ncbi:MAG: OmpA family protein [Chitinophagaceae bacterium]
MKHIKTIACFCLLVSQLPANAQQFGIELNAGLQGLNYGITNGSAKLQPGGSLGVNYTFLFAKKWGLLTGIYGNYYATKATLQDGATFSSYQVDDAGSAFLYHVKTVGYSETQQLLTAGIPVMLQYHTTGNGAQWYINAGTRIILPFHGKIKAKASQVTSSGYYPDFNIEVVDLPQHGFGTVSNWQSNTKMDFKPTATASAATGISFKFSGTTRLYTGIYADYGLTNMRKGDANQSMVTYSATSASAIQTASILNTPYAGNPKLLAFGVQVRLTLEKHKTKAKPQEQPAPPPPVLKQIVLVDTVKPAPVQQSQPKEQPAPVQPAAVPAISSREEAVVSQPLTFEKIGETSVPDKLKSHLDSVVVILLQYPDLRVEVKGYTCDIGTEKRNLHIGEERAKAVAVYLQQKGVAESRIDIRSAGESEPLVPNTSEANRMLNRRVTIIIEE